MRENSENPFYNYMDKEIKPKIKGNKEGPEFSTHAGGAGFSPAALRRLETEKKLKIRWYKVFHNEVAPLPQTIDVIDMFPSQESEVYFRVDENSGKILDCKTFKDEYLEPETKTVLQAMLKKHLLKQRKEV